MSRRPFLPFVLLGAACARTGVHGTVQDEAGHPVTGATVAAIAARNGLSADATRPVAWTKSDAQGRFALAVLPAGTYALTATAPQRTAAFVEKVVLGAGDKRAVDLVVGGRGGRLFGRFTDQQGHPLRAQIRAARYSKSIGDIFITHTRTNGDYEIELPPAEYRLLLVVDGAIRYNLLTDANADHRIEIAPPPAEVVTWLKSHAMSIDDLSRVVGNARVVVAGEANHGGHEFHEIKARLFRSLVEQRGFTVLGIEAPFVETTAIDQYVQTGTGEVDRLLAGLRMWPWQTDDLADLLRWMRRYNEQHPHRLSVYGFDIQSTRPCTEKLAAYLRKVDPKAAEPLEAALRPLATDAYPASYSKQPQSERAAVSAAITELIEDLDRNRAAYIGRAGNDEWLAERHCAEVLRQSDAELNAPPKSNEIRDRAMAENVQWMLDHAGSSTRMFLWSHNSHASLAPYPSFQPMAMQLHHALGSQLVSMGFAFNRGAFHAYDAASLEKGLQVFAVGAAPVGTLDATLAAAGLPVAAWDLRSLGAEESVRRWFDQPLASRQFGFSYDTDDVFFEETVTKRFDALIFVDGITPSLLPGRKTN